jgi:Secretion system C-terminal sorting domain
MNEIKRVCCFSLLIQIFINWRPFLMKNFLLLAIAVMFSLPQLSAAPAIKIAELQGGKASNIIQTHAGNIYASTQTSLYKFEKNTEQWHKVFSAAADQTQNNYFTTADKDGNSGVVFYAQPNQGGDPTFKITRDQGENWSDITFPEDLAGAYGLQVFQGFGGEFVVSFRKNGKFATYISYDNCEKFEKFEEQNSRIDFVDEETIIRIFGKKLQKYKGDYEWEDMYEFSSNLGTFAITENFIFGLDGKQFYYTADMGENWAEASTGIDFTETEYYAFMIPGPNDKVILNVMSTQNSASPFNYLYSYNSETGEWTKILDTGIERLGGLPVCVLDDGSVLSSNNNGVTKYDYASNEWTSMGTGIAAALGAQFLLTNNDKLMYVDAANMLYMCEKDGYNREVSSYYTLAIPTSRIYRIMKAIDGNIIVTNQDGIFTSTDNGDNWTMTSTGATGVIKEALSKNLYFAHESKIYKSEDAGLNWAEYYENPVAIRALAVTELDELIVSDEIALVKLDTDLNKTTILEESNTIPFYHMKNGLVLLASINQFTMSIRKTTDMGENWVEVTNQFNPPQNGFFGLQFSSNGDFLMSAGQGYLSVKALEDTLSYDQVDGAYFISNFFALDEDNALLLDIYGVVYQKEFITSVIDQITDNEEDVFYPNPVDREITFKENHTNAQLVVYDNQGKIVHMGVIHGMMQNVDLSKLNSGVYFFKLESSKDIKAGKFIKR